MSFAFVTIPLLIIFINLHVLNANIDGKNLHDFDDDKNVNF